MRPQDNAHFHRSENELTFRSSFVDNGIRFRMTLSVKGPFENPENFLAVDSLAGDSLLLGESAAMARTPFVPA
jgi:hypothetical protein